jgi:hypothetical protein
MKFEIALSLTVGWLIHRVAAIEIKTGEGSKFSVKQGVYADYIILTDTASAYYQYFVSTNETSKQNLLVFFGNYLDRSAVKEASFGFSPYFYLKQGSQGDVKAVWNPASVNQYANILVIDIVRGTGFSKSNDPAAVNFDTIASDMEVAITKFRDQFPSSKSYNDQLFIYAGYQMVQPALLFLNKTQLPFKAIFGSSWLGYPSIDQLHVTMPAYGYTDRKQLDDISNKMYGLQVKDYSKDIDEMFDDLSSILNLLDSSDFIDFNNPTLPQNQVYKLSDGFDMFYTDCMGCRSYLNVFETNKNAWKPNQAVMQGLKRDIITDIRTTLLDICRLLSKQTGDRQKEFMMIESGNSLKTNIQTLEDITVNNFIVDNSLIYGYLRMSKITLPLENNAKIDIESCPECGFYSLVEQDKGATSLVSFFSYIYNTTEAKNLENEFNFQTSQLRKNMVNF